MIQKILIILFYSYSMCIFALPHQILIIGCGEMPIESKNSHVTMRGYKRAYALVPLFAHMPLPQDGNFSKNIIEVNSIKMFCAVYGQPVALYAQGCRAAQNFQAIMTLTPLSQTLHIDINSSIIENSYDKKNPKKHEKKYEQLVNEVMKNSSYENKNVLLCWECTAIPTITQAFLTQYAYGVDLPRHLSNSKIFKSCDRIFRLTCKNKNIVNFDNIAQELLVGDSGSVTNEFYVITPQAMVRTK